MRSEAGIQVLGLRLISHKTWNPVTFLPFMSTFANLDACSLGAQGVLCWGPCPWSPFTRQCVCGGEGASYPPLRVCLLLEETAWPLAPRMCRVGGVQLKALS